MTTIPGLTIPSGPILAALKLINEHAPHLLSAEGRGVHDAETNRIADRDRAHASLQREIHNENMARAFPGTRRAT